MQDNNPDITLIRSGSFVVCLSIYIYILSFFVFEGVVSKK